MAVSLYAANEGYLQDIELNKVLDFEGSLLSYMNSESSDLMASINESGDYNEDIEGQFKAALEKFKSTQSW
jgi:F-type H+-transporting ATPase subunit alpha